MMDYYLSVHHEFGPVSNVHGGSQEGATSGHNQPHQPPALLDRDPWPNVDGTSSASIPPPSSANLLGLASHFPTAPVIPVIPGPGPVNPPPALLSSTPPVHQPSPPSPQPLPPGSTETTTPPGSSEFALAPLYVSATSGGDAGLSSAVFSPVAANSSYSYQPTYRDISSRDRFGSDSALAASGPFSPLSGTPLPGGTAQWGTSYTASTGVLHLTEGFRYRAQTRESFSALSRDVLPPLDFRNTATHREGSETGDPSSQYYQYRGGSTGSGAGSGGQGQSQGRVSPGLGSYRNHSHESQPGMGPSGMGAYPTMSVNLSMSMNLGLPPGISNPQNGYPSYPSQNHWSYHSPRYGTVPPAGSPRYGSSSSSGPSGGASSDYFYRPQPMPDVHFYETSHTSPTSSFYSMNADIKGDMYHHGEAGMDARGSKFDHHVSSEQKQTGTSSPYSERLNPTSGGGLYGGGGLRPHAAAGIYGSSAMRTQSGIVTPSKSTNVCKICGKSYARPSTLKTHLRTHSGERPYRCPTCDKTFSQAANLTAHVRTHSGEKPFRCPMCDRRFSQSSSVTTHMRTHSGERPYRCATCRKAFSDSSTLTKHTRVHSGEKPYQCHLCLLRFSQSGNLTRHMRVHTNSG